jgi:hypothetical protein
MATRRASGGQGRDAEQGEAPPASARCVGVHGHGEGKGE